MKLFNRFYLYHVYMFSFLHGCYIYVGKANRKQIESMQSVQQHKLIVRLFR